MSEEQQLSPGGIVGAGAGTTSAIFGSTAVVGAPGETTDCSPGGGAAYVYTRNVTVWTKVATLCASDGMAGDAFGTSVSINAGNIAVGAPGRNADTGAVYVYSGAGSTWMENGTILSQGAVAGGKLGTAVSIQGFTVAAGAPNSDIPGPHGSVNTGVTIVYTSNDAGANWTHTTFRPNGGQARVNGYFGSAVSLSGSTILVGAPGFHTGQKANSGAVFVFVNTGGIWTQQARIRPANTENVYTGTSVSLFQNKGAFGAPGANTVYVYSRSGTTWSQQGAVIQGSNGDGLGASVAIQGSPFSVLAAGAPNANSNAGRAYEFGSSGGAFSLLNELLPTTAPSAGDEFGASAGFDAGRIIVGAPDGNASPGSAYIFKVRNASTTTITGIVDDGHFDEDSLTGVPYSVFVTVADPDSTTTPTGSVHVDDSNGGSCDASLSESMTGVATGSCALTSNFFGSLTMNASYGGDLSFAASSDSAQHKVTGNHLAFNPMTPPNVLQGSQETGVIVELHNGADEVITDDNSTVVALTVADTCVGDPITIGTLTLTNGVADFSNLGPRFYTATTGGTLNYVAQQSPFDLNTSPSSATSGAFDVDANSDLLFGNGFENGCL